MKVRAFEEKDFEVVAKWKLARDPYFPPRSHFPVNGYMVDGIACIFLILTDCSMCFLEFFISNPDVSLEDRLKAFDLLIVSAEKDAKNLGYDVITGNTCFPKVMSLGLRYGFVTDARPYYYFSKHLGEDHARSTSASIDAPGTTNATAKEPAASPAT